MKNKSRLGTMVSVIVVGGTVAFGGVLGMAVGSSGTTDVAVVSCGDLPELWSGSERIAYDPVAGTLTLAWDGAGGVGTTAAVKTSDTTCASQPGLAQQALAIVAGNEQAASSSCASLRGLVAGITAANPRASGVVAVPAGLDAKLVGAAVGEKTPAGRTVDISRAKSVLRDFCAGRPQD